MSISIIVEDGSNVANANAYVSVADARTFATNRGVTLPASDDDVAAWIIKASDFLEAQACRYQGERANADQSLEWPRTGVYLNGSETEFPSDQIPKQLILAQCQLVVAQSQGFELQPNYSAKAFVTEKTVGPITTKYADPTQVGIVPTLTAADAALAPLFGECATSKFALSTARV